MFYKKKLLSVQGRVTFLTEDITAEEVQKVSGLVSCANKVVSQYFGAVTSFDILICRGSWEMEVQVISRRAAGAGMTRKGIRIQDSYDITNYVGLTDYHTQEIIIRYDAAKFGHYLHELIHGVISKDHPHQLREGLAWYFTLKLTEKHRYTRPSYPSWVDDLYVQPVRRLAQIVEDDFLKDLALGKASLEIELLPPELQRLFLPEELFYTKKR